MHLGWVPTHQRIDDVRVKQHRGDADASSMPRPMPRVASAAGLTGARTLKHDHPDAADASTTAPPVVAPAVAVAGWRPPVAYPAPRSCAWRQPRRSRSPSVWYSSATLPGSSSPTLLSRGVPPRSIARGPTSPPKRHKRQQATQQETPVFPLFETLVSLVSFKREKKYKIEREDGGWSAKRPPKNSVVIICLVKASQATQRFSLCFPIT